MKKILPFVLISIILLNLFAGCSRQSEAPKFPKPIPTAEQTAAPAQTIPDQTKVPSPAVSVPKTSPTPDPSIPSYSYSLNVGVPRNALNPYIYHTHGPSDRHYSVSLNELSGVDIEIMTEIAKLYFPATDIIVDDTEGLAYNMVGVHPIDCVIGLEKRSVMIGAYSVPTDVIYTDEHGDHVFYVNKNSSESILPAMNSAISILKENGTIDCILQKYQVVQK